jgi:hypothetical protein
MVRTDTVKMGGSQERNNEEAQLDQEGPTMKPVLNENDLQGEDKSWAMEVYKGDDLDQKMSGTEEEGMLEFDLDDEETTLISKVMAIAVYYSRKSYSPQFLFSDMVKAWNIQRLAGIEKIRDYIFKLEFNTPEERLRVLDGGPWRHKGDAHIVVHYDGLIRPSEISIKSIGMWVHFYYLPSAMMKEQVAKQLGGNLGTYFKMDCRYPGYMRIRVDYPLDKPLPTQLFVKIKGRGQMPITLRYENVPHFCFACGCIGHTAVNCQEIPSNEQDIRFGEELRASLQKRVKTIYVQLVDGRVARPLFQVPGVADMNQAGTNETGQVRHKGIRPMHPHARTPNINEEVNKVAHHVRVMCNSEGSSRASQNSGGKGRVSFGMNMSTEEEVSNGGSVELNLLELMIATEHFVARKFKEAQGMRPEKKDVLKAIGTCSNKKQKTSVKSHVKEAL